MWVFYLCAPQVSGADDQEIVFTHGKHQLAGTLMLPEKKGPYAIIVFVHGDGPTPRDNYGAYRPLWNAFLGAGFGVYSWDKAGVGQSTGDWLSQSMDDRAAEVIAAGEALMALKGVDIDYLGLWGISQAGWVLPITVTQSQIFSSMIIVSGAINWIDQSLYLTEKRLRFSGAAAVGIEKALAWEKKQMVIFSQIQRYEQYRERMQLAPKCCNHVMSKARWQFAIKNNTADSTPYLSAVTIPVLAIFGEFDANVDIEQSQKIYRREIASSRLTLKVFSKADHGLMPANRMQPLGMKTTFRDLYKLLKIEFFGANAYVPNYINTMTQWTREHYEAKKNN